jgi:hypothetical protein
MGICYGFLHTDVVVTLAGVACMLICSWGSCS